MMHPDNLATREQPQCARPAALRSIAAIRRNIWSLAEAINPRLVTTILIKVPR